MHSYRRNIKLPLMLQNLVILPALALIVYLFTRSMNDYAWFCIVMVSPMMLFPVTGIVISKTALNITKYYFAFIPFIYTFSNKPDGKNFLSVNEWEGKTQPPIVNTDTPFDLLMWFYPRKTIREKYLLVYSQKERNKILQVKLTAEEHDLVLDFIENLKRSSLSSAVDYKDLG